MKIGEVTLAQVGGNETAGKTTLADAIDAIRGRIGDGAIRNIVSAELDAAVFDVKARFLPDNRYEARTTTNKTRGDEYVDGNFYTYQGVLTALDDLARVDAGSLSAADRAKLGALFTDLLTEDPARSALGFVDISRHF